MVRIYLDGPVQLVERESNLSLKTVLFGPTEVWDRGIVEVQVSQQYARDEHAAAAGGTHHRLRIELKSAML